MVGKNGVPPETRLSRSNLTYLQEDALSLIAIITGAVGYVWLWLDIWPITGSHVAIQSWIGGAVLTIGTLTSHRVRRSHLHFATYLLISSLIIASVSATLTFPLPAMIYLCTLPIIFASVLLSQRGVFLVGLVVGATMLTIQASRYPLDAEHIEALVPIAVLVCLIVASWLSAHNLYTTLAWFSDAYSSASTNEQIARDHEAELRRALKALDDMTYRLERANHTLTLERNEAQEARRLKQQFTQTISHELRTPLNIIIAFTELMAQSPDYYGAPLSPAYVRDLSIIHRNASHLQTLVNDVLDLARIEAAQMVVIPEEADPVLLVQEAIQTVRSLVEMRGLTLDVLLRDDLPHLWIDTTRIRQVLFNLLNNAVRFTPKGKITVDAQQQGSMVVFSVIDTGIGIAPDDLKYLFVEFHQLSSGTRRMHDGAGLGLAISRRFVELHGGEIWVESKPGQGSAFRFSLPIKRRQATGPLEQPPAAIVPSSNGQGSVEGVVLAVTGSLQATALLTRHLQGYHAVIVPTLDQVKATAERVLPDCIVLDAAYQNPDVEAIKGIAQSLMLQDIPILVCPLPGEDLMRQALEVEGYLVKPVSAHHVQDVLRQMKQAIERILVIEDDRDFVQMLSRLLTNPRNPHQVYGAYSAQEGLALIQRYRPDLILLDLQLPDMSGLDLIPRIRQLPAYKNTPIVVISGEDQVDFKDRAVKPILFTRPSGVTPADIIRSIQGALTSH